MKVRVFVPDAAAQPGPVSYTGKDHLFPILPSPGHVLHFENEPRDFAVRTVGFVQSEDAFVPAVWLEAGPTASVSVPDDPAAPDRAEPYRDLNHDVPPEIMTDY